MVYQTCSFFLGKRKTSKWFPEWVHWSLHSSSFHLAASRWAKYVVEKYVCDTRYFDLLPQQGFSVKHLRCFCFSSYSCRLDTRHQVPPGVLLAFGVLSQVRLVLTTTQVISATQLPMKALSIGFTPSLVGVKSASLTHFLRFFPANRQDQVGERKNRDSAVGNRGL